MIENINLGSAPNDKTGDKARVAGQKINANFAYLEAKIDNKSYLKIETGFALVGQDLTLNADWEWIINNIDYTNPSSVVINIPFAASGKSRIDLIVCNSSNTFNRVAGIESVSTPVAPALPTNTVMATFFTVTDGTISTPSVPSTGGAVDSVNGMTGAVTLGISEIPLLEAELAAKLDASAYNQHFKGKYTSSGALTTAHPTSTDGDYAIVDAGTGVDAKEWIWDNEEGWIVGGATGASTTDGLTEGSSNLYFTSARVLANLLSGLTASSGTFSSSDSLLTAFGKIKYLIDNIATTYQAILVSGTNIKTKGGISLLGAGDIPNSAKITTTVSITNATLTVAGDVQEGKIVKIDNGVNVINYTVNGALNASFIKMGTGAITFVQGSGRTLTGANGTLVLNGAVNSTASIVSDGTVDLVYINNLS